MNFNDYLEVWTTRGAEQQVYRALKFFTLQKKVKMGSSAFRVEDKFGWTPTSLWTNVPRNYPREQLLGISPKKAAPRNYPVEPIQILRIVENRAMYFEFLVP